METNGLKLVRRLVVLGLLLFTTFPNVLYAEVSTHTITQFTSVPINLTGNDVTPLVMMNVSRDHQLSYKAYNDFADLDADGVPETTYKDSIDYYGYFDSKKCYSYSTANNRFEPAALATGSNNHYCVAGSGQWSGNFLNWATMTRMDIVRKMLYGGMRSTDTSTLTVLERHYLPTDAHAFAKFYNGNDIDTLTPFSGIATVPPESTSNTSRTIPNHTTGTDNRTFTTSLSVTIGDQIKVFVTGNEANQWMIGGVSNTGAGTITIQIPAGSYEGTGTSSNWTLKNLSQTGITICNLTKGSTSGVNQYSDTNTNPPVIRVARGNFALWTANERWQGYWSGEKSNLQSGFAGGFRSNGNKAYLSGINASAENPSQTTHGIGTGSAQGEYIARIEVVNPAWLGHEKYKEYNSSYKPIGLLQVYGEADQIHFGLMTGTFTKNISGGVLRKNVGTFTNEVNTADGTFVSGANGIVHNLNKLRLYGYNYSDGTYIGRDNCNYQQTGLVLTGGSTSQGSPANQGNCSTWGNPMSEIYLESLRYLAGKLASTAFVYGASSKDETLGLTVAGWSDPLNAVNYCAPLNVLNFNASVSSYDGNQMGGVTDLGSLSTAAALTDTVGVHEGINASSWFIGSNGVTSNDLCTSKSIGSGFGSYSGLCPEAPTQQGTYLMSGVAHYANTNRIRTDLSIPAARANSRDLKVNTYGIALATNVPKIEVTAEGKKVTILPAYRLDRSSTGAGPFGGGTLVDFKIITQTPTYGKFYVNWEDSEMGGDYDQDMWGTIEYSVNGNTIRITTDAVSASTANGQGFGYIISGTDKDGAHFHSGIYNFDYTDSTGVIGCNNCVVSDPPTFADYTIIGSSAGVLEDPLLYAAKWGGFIDSNNNKLPDLPSEWDAVNNDDGSTVSDGIPDNYFYATNPLQLENSLNRVFLTIVQRASSGTAAAVVSNNVSGVGALYQAYYEPLRQDAANKKVSWIGTVQALWLDDYGYLREDKGNKAVLDGYFTDQVIQQFYDEVENKTKVRRYVSTKDDEFMPYYMKGKVTDYNAGTGAVTFTVTEIGGTAGSGPYGEWTVNNLTNNKTGNSNTSSSIMPINDSLTFTVIPATTGFANGDMVMMTHFESTLIPLENVGTLWNAREQLSFTGADASIQRNFTDKADGEMDGGRFIKTWIDADGDSVVDAGEFIDFDRTAVTVANYGYFNLATEADAKNLTDYVRGKEIPGYRSRTINYDGTGDKVMRLSDVVNATPSIVGAPQEALDLLYKDASYGTFKKQYAKRRQVLYVGSNGGMLHAFNGGFYDAATKSFLVSGKKHDGSPAVNHPLGAEIWAYVPMNLLPHLKWLKDNSYSHVYYVDGKPKVFDANIFTADSDHPGGWGTVLVVGMRFGGGSMTVDTAADGLNGDPNDREFRSAYVIMDITNPEVEPKLLAEIQVPHTSFSTSYPTAIAVKDSTKNKWFLIFGSGPTNLSTAESNQNARIYAFDLGEIAVPGSSSVTPPLGCTRLSVGAGGSMRIISCDTGVLNSFVGDPVAVDWELDYKADSVYFGIVGDKNANTGQVMRFGINGKDDPVDWTFPATLMNNSQPVVAVVTPGMDETGQKWVFFGTGRFFVGADQSSTETQSIYGVKESGGEILITDLIDVSDAKVQTDGDLTGVSGAINVDLLKTLVSTKKGWYLDLPPIEGVAGTAPATRVINPSALAGGILFTSVYQPGIDLCTGEGFSRLYGLYYKTGTANPNPAVFGTELKSGVEYVKPYIELGHGFATTPSLHTGSGTGDDSVNVFTQLSTGTIIRTEASTGNVRSGLESWIEPR